MAWYTGTYSCGHEGRINVIGPGKDRQWKVDRNFSNKCPECEEIDRLKRIEEINEKAAQITAEWELPALTGSEAQVKWATSLRIAALEKINSSKSDYTSWKYIIHIYHFLTDESLKSDELFAFVKSYKENCLPLIEMIDSYLLSQTKASWWIDRRSGDWYQEIFHDLYKLSQKNEEIALPDLSSEQEATIAPESTVHNGVVQISEKSGNLIASYAKNDDFIAIVKKLGFTWSGSVWKLELTETTGTYIDRAGELGNILLQNGFTICLYDNEARQKAIDGTYEPECKRWIYRRTDTNKFAIKWNRGEPESIYNNAKKLPGATWSNGSMLVNVANYVEVLDFADVYGFKMTSKAQTLMNEYQNYINNAEKVIPVVPEQPEQVDALKKILTSAGTIITDLSDED